MSMAPVAAMTSGNAAVAMKSKIQSIAWSGPAMNPSSDMALFTTTLPVPVLVSLTRFLRRTMTPRSISWVRTPVRMVHDAGRWAAQRTTEMSVLHGLREDYDKRVTTPS